MILIPDKNKYKFKFVDKEEARKYFITQSTIATIPHEVLDEDGYIVDIENYM